MKRMLAAVVVTVGAVLSLSGCLYAQIPENPVAVEPTATPSPAAPSTEPDDPIDEPTSDVPATMTFADGQLLAPSTHIEWGDGFFASDTWKTTSPDDGNGGWEYGTLDDTCTAQFWQGLTPDVPTVAGDDSASSDAILAVLLQATTADITPLATTGAISYQSGGSRLVEARQLFSDDDAWAMTARAFTATGVGLYVIVDCTGASASATMDEVLDANAIVITP